MIEQDLQNLTAAINALTAAITGGTAVAATSTAVAEKPAKATKAAKEKVESPTTTGQSEVTQPVTTDAPATAAPATAAASAPASGADVEQLKNDIRTLAVKLSTDVGPNTFVEILGRYGFTTMKEFPAARYSELIDHLRRVLAEGTSAI